MNKAVNDTNRQVVVFGRSLASTVYSANGGGHSASREEGFGTAGDGFPYLRPAPYLTNDPSPWSVQVAMSDVAGRFGYRGTLTNVAIQQAGPSGRALQVVLDGSAGPKAVAGRSFAANLGLKSTLFTLHGGTADKAPPPPASRRRTAGPPGGGGAGRSGRPRRPGGRVADVPAVSRAGVDDRAAAQRRRLHPAVGADRPGPGAQPGRRAARSGRRFRRADGARRWSHSADRRRRSSRE